VILAALMLLTLAVSAIPFAAYADEMDELETLRARKAELTGQVEEIKERILGLQEQKANVLEQMVALRSSTAWPRSSSK
jgi:predicted  nucleic acid-binding Zn-ribbon protein